MSLFLSQTNYLASGSTRNVYLHPSNPDICLKIQKNLGTQNHNEQRFLENCLYPDYSPKCFGSIDSNLGACLAVELVKDYDGTISKSLLDYLLQKNISMPQANFYIRLISEHFLQHLYLIHDGGLSNILLRQTSPDVFTPILIDGFGPKRNDIKNRVRLKIPFLIRHKTRKQVKTMFNKVKELSNI